MTPGPGRGHPVVFDPHRREQYLAHIADGMKAHEAAVRAGVSRNLPSQHAAADPSFAAALTVAKAKGRAQRIDDMPHDESRYVNYGCRCPICTKDATTKRATRPDRRRPEPADHAAPPTRPEVIRMPNPPRTMLPSLPLARAS